MSMLIRWLLRRCLGEADAGVFLSELEEMYLHRVEMEGRSAADRWRRAEMRQAALNVAASRIRRDPKPDRPRERSVRSIPSVGESVGRVVRDVRVALRALRQRPLFALIAVGTLALGIGANTAIFSVVNALFLRSPPYRAPEELVQVYTGFPFSAQPPTGRTSYREFLELRELTEAFAEVEAYETILGSVREEGGPRAAYVEAVTPGLLGMLGLEPILGRTFLPEEGVSPGEHPVAILGHAYWQRVYGGDPGVPGRTIHLAGQSYSVVGVAPPALKALQGAMLTADLLVPMTMAQAVDGASGVASRPDRFPSSVNTFARLAPGVSLEQAQLRAEGLYRRIPRTGQEPPEDWSFRLYPLEDQVISPQIDAGLTTIAAFLFSVVGLVLLLACTNLANLLLARGKDREKEIAVRLALGAGRRRLVVQLLTETVILALLGGIAGLLMAQWTLGLLLRLQPRIGVTFNVDVSPDGPVLLFTFGVAALTGILFGLVPALAATRPDVTPALKGEADSYRRRRLSLRSGLVAFQMAVSVILLAGASLFLRSLIEAQNTDLGFSTREAGTVWVDLVRSGVPPSDWSNTIEELKIRARTQVGIRVLGAADALPLLGRNTARFAVSGVTPPEGQSGHSVTVFRVDEGFREAMGIPLRSGRWIQGMDRPGAQDVVVVSEAAARRFWADRSPVGQEIRSSRDDRSYRVVGVVGDVKVDRLSDRPERVFYFSLAQQTVSRVWMVATGDRSPSELVGDLRQAVREVSPDLLIMQTQTMEERIGVNLYPARMAALLLGAFGLVALTLAAIGLYGIVSLAVSRRIREVGIRMSLGANAGQVMSMVVMGSMGSVVLGGLAGLGLAYGLARLIRGLLFGVAPADPLTLLTVPLLLGAVATVATFIPARRASRVDPVRALNSE